MTNPNQYLSSDGERFYMDEEQRYHRIGGPALVKADGTAIWYYHGKRHSACGPAVTRPDGSEEYWIHGKRYSEKKWQTKSLDIPSYYTRLIVGIIIVLVTILVSIM